MRLAPIFALLLALAFAPSFAPGASAQLPVSAGCGPLSIPNAPVSPDPLAAGREGTLTIEVQNAGRLSATVNVALTLSEQGWRVVSVAPDTAIPAGQSASFTFVVAPTEEATGDALAQFAASGFCDTPLGAQCPAGACSAGVANSQVTVGFVPRDGFRFPGLEGLDFPPEYLIAAIVLVGLATAIPLVLRRKTGGVVAECPEPLKMVKPGRGTSFPIEIRNGSKEGVTAGFEVGPVPEGWSAFMPLPEVQLAARESRSLWLMVRSPATAKVGDAVEVELRLKDPRAKGSRAVRVRAEVQAGSPDAPST